MTDVAEAIVNGEGESSSAADQSTDFKDGRGGTEDEGTLVDDSVNENNGSGEIDEFQAMETSDSISNQLGEDGIDQPDEMDGEEEEEEKDEDPSSNVDDSDYSYTTAGGVTITKSNTTRETFEEGPTIIKVEAVNSHSEENQMEDEVEEEEQNSNSAEYSEPVLLNCKNNDVDSGGGGGGDDNTSENEQPATPPPPSQSVRNGRGTINDDNSSDKPLLTGLLRKKDSGSSPKSTSSQSSSSYSLNDGNAIAKGLEDHVEKLDNLLILKEKEWSAILRLKKHLEYALDQVKCTQRMGKVQEGMNGPMSATDVKACLNLIAGHKDLLESEERRIEDSIECTEVESEYLQTVFPGKSDSQLSKDEGESVSKGETLTASAALQQLCERKRKAMDEPSPARGSRVRIIDVRSSQSPQSKVIGNGRKGAIVDVQSIIDSHRTTSNQSFKHLRRSKKAAYTDLINLGPDKQYCKIIEDLAPYCGEGEKPMKEITTITMPSSTSTISQVPIPKPLIVVNKPKNGTGRPVRQSGGNSLLHPTPCSSSTGTLAKMLSPSTHSSIGSNRGSSNDGSPSSQKFANKHANADANLSLANLLATSKVETNKINISKIKKERVARDEDSSHVPSQQEQVPVCQGCNLSRAQFVCAGCANQWYCSRECQVAAWDEHSEICSG